MNIRRGAEWALVAVVAVVTAILVFSLGWDKGFSEGVMDCARRFL